MKPDELTRLGVEGPQKDVKELTILLDDDLYRYLSFLEKVKIVGHREEAVLAALRIFKKLNMHDWLPFVYRLGSERVLMMEQGMLHDIFTSMSKVKLYEIARITALKRKVIKPFDPELDLSEPCNWGVILNELENMGWGKFTQKGTEVKVEFLGVPIIFLKGYLETLFEVEFMIRQTKRGEVYVLCRERSKAEVWR